MRPLARITLVLAGLLLGLVAGEIVVRLFDLGPRFQVVFSENYEISDNATLGYVLKPGSVKGLYRINSGGFRDREFSEEKPPGVFRIVVVGDSVTFGLLCDAGSAYPKQLESLLNEQATGGAPRFEVLNLGVTGYNISQVVEFLRVVGTRYEPDLIVTVELNGRSRWTLLVEVKSNGVPRRRSWPRPEKPMAPAIICSEHILTHRPQ